MSVIPITGLPKLPDVIKFVAILDGEEAEIQVIFVETGNVVCSEIEIYGSCKRSPEDAIVRAAKRAWDRVQEAVELSKKLGIEVRCE